MALIKKVNELDKIEIVGDYKHIQIRSATWVEDDETGETFGAKQYSRRVIAPNDDISGESAEVQALVAAVHTDQIKADYEAFVDAQQAEVAPQEV
jgi:hypothetical protein